MKATDHIETLEGAAIQVASAEYELIFMDDNAPIHRAGLVIEWKTLHCVDSLNWPPYSPDLNPIENVRGFIKRKIHSRAHLPLTLAEFDAAVRQKWESLSVAYAVI